MHECCVVKWIDTTADTHLHSLTLPDHCTDDADADDDADDADDAYDDDLHDSDQIAGALSYRIYVT